ncbi:MAG: galactosyldiacylglycerol synthase [Bryobacterales bacterium]|nr:galactosyldiacylglycerol synthase [Bryobacterales bacterium]
MPKIHLLFFDAGGGHRSAATALEAAACELYPNWDIELINIGKLLEPLDFFHKYIGIAGEDIYNKILQHGLTLGAVGMLRATQNIVRLNRKGIRRLMGAYWQRTKPDLVVSLIPNFNLPLFQALREVCPGSSYMTVMTDMADFPPHFWMEKQAQYIVCGSKRAVEQARAIGYRSCQIFEASGMILQPKFYQQSALNVAKERERLGLLPELATAMVLFGGHGAAVMEDIYEKLQRSRLPVQGIFICGKNDRLAKDLAKTKGRMPALVEGFTKEIPHFMRLSDFFIGKPGPGSISEAIHMNLPVIVQRNAWTLPQERYNTDWVEENRVGLVVRGFREVVKATTHLLEGDRLQRYRSNAQAIQNRAVFEVPRWMAQALKQGPAVPE